MRHCICESKHLEGQDRLKGDERILGESDFVMDVLSQANEKFSRQYELKRLGYDLERVEQKVTEIYRIEREELYSRKVVRRGEQKREAFSYWAVRELGVSGASLAERFGMSQPGVE